MKVAIPETVLATELEDEGVLLNLETGEYFGLDDVGLGMWKVLGTSRSVEDARAALLEQYDVAEEVLSRDLSAFVAELAERKLLVVTDE
ncbi:MAG TPA: PqqD family protein [Pseudomonadota bacterium]|nr:PqqD family protein [Pseudomonadota bacterium]